MKIIGPWRIVGVLAAAALFVAACGDDNGATTTTAPAPPSPVDITVTATEFAFDPDTIQVAAGAEVTFTLVNGGSAPHDITIDELAFQLFAQPGETVSDTVTVPAGVYEFYCSVAGHRALGMEGELVASG
jgi:plastocyanin